jgi:RsiW-degrading membrane proteinase PrsW (M82 family)
VAWLLYLWRLNRFSRQPFPFLLTVLLLGGLSALLSLIASDSLAMLSPLDPDANPTNRLLYSLVQIGMVEEAAKLLPVLLVVRRARAPFDLVLFASLSALGFASLENALYFTHLGLGLALPRFLLSTVLHMAVTGLAGYAWARGLYWRAIQPQVALLAGYLLASAFHGLYDFFLLEASLARWQMLSLALLFLLVREYYRLLQNALNFSLSLAGPERRLRSAGLLFATAFTLVVIVYLHSNFEFSTAIANRQLLTGGLVSLPAALGIFGALGSLPLRPGYYKPLLPRLFGTRWKFMEQA